MVLSEPLIALLTNNWIAKALLVTVTLVLTDLLLPEPLWLVALLVAMAIGVGHELDQLARQRLSPLTPEATPRQLLADLESYNPWWVFALCSMGRLAATDGEVLPAHRALAEEILARLSARVDGDSRAFARRGLKWFYAGGRQACPFSDVAAACAGSPDAGGEALVMECLGRAAQLRETAPVAAAMADLGALLRFRGGASRAPHETPGARFRSTSSGLPGAMPRPSDAELKEAAALLSVPLDAASDAIRLAYRRGVARYHPDRLPASATAYDVEMAEEQMTRYREAYERLLASGANNR